jgi:hypothetical protein
MPRRLRVGPVDNPENLATRSGTRSRNRELEPPDKAHQALMLSRERDLRLGAEPSSSATARQVAPTTSARDDLTFLEHALHDRTNHPGLTPGRTGSGARLR